MSYATTVYKVMIASPTDVAAERSIIREVLYEWNTVNSDSRRVVLLPVGWETDTSPEMGEPPQSIINKQILEDCDLLVGVFWTRIGTSTEEYASGTVAEIEEHMKAGKPVMLYFSGAPVHPDSVDQEQYAELKKFRQSCESRGIYETYGNLNDFRSKFYRQLQLKMNKEKYFLQEISAADHPPEVEPTMPLQNIPSLSREAQVLLKEVSQDSVGNIIHLPYLGGLAVQTNGKDFVPDSNPRTVAIWEGVLKELENAGLISDLGHKREVFRITREGYDVAEVLNP